MESPRGSALSWLPGDTIIRTTKWISSNTNAFRSGLTYGILYFRCLVVRIILLPASLAAPYASRQGALDCVEASLLLFVLFLVPRSESPEQNGSV